MKKIEFTEPGIIFLSKGTLAATGKRYWAYALIPEDKIAGYFQAKAQGPVDLKDHGHIICWDEGIEPPEDIKKEMAELYGTDDAFTEKFIARLEKAPGGKQFIEMVKKEMAKFSGESSGA